MDRFKNWAIGFGLLMLVLAATAVSHGVSSDTFTALANFREIADQSQFAASDPFAYTTTHSKPFHSHWGVGAVLHGFMVLSGWETHGLLILKLLLCFGIAIACHGLSVRNGVSLTTFAVLSMLALALATPLRMAEVQPALFSAAALVGLFYLLWADQNLEGYWAWGVVPLMALWANFHEGVILGLVILATYCLTRTAHQFRESRTNPYKRQQDLYLWLVLFASGAAVLLNPDGSRLYNYFLAQAVCNPEWGFEHHPIWQTQSILVQLIFLASIAVAGYGIVFSKPWPTFESVVLLVTCTFALNQVAYAPMYLVTWICLVSPLIDRKRIASEFSLVASRHRIQIASITIAIGLVGLGSALQNRYWEMRVIGEPEAIARNETVFPIAASNFLADRAFSGNVLVPDYLGGYVAWRLHPNVRVSADDRKQLVYAKETLKRNMNFFGAVENWSSLIEPSTDAILIPAQTPVSRRFEREINQGNFAWKSVYRDSGFTIFVRTGTQVAQRLDSSTTSN